jgi:N-acyl homoserine lactone hydrolase
METDMCIACFVQTTHPTEAAKLGRRGSSKAMEAVIDKPGPLEIETVASADWVAPLSGLLNLKDPKAIKAGLKDRDEPIKIYTHLVRHPSAGAYMIDTGVSKRFVNEPKAIGVGLMVRNFAKLDRMKVLNEPLSAVQSKGVPLAGVLMTHLHFDHVSGMPDIPTRIPFYTGFGEANTKQFQNVFVLGMENKFFEGRPAIREFQFTKDPDDRFEGVTDVFGDETLFTILTPGHTAGHVSFVARTTNGPVLLTGDTCHTRWGWENGVEPGTYTFDRAKERKSLLALKALSDRHPNMTVRLGHQPL